MNSYEQFFKPPTEEELMRRIVITNIIRERDKCAVIATNAGRPDIAAAILAQSQEWTWAGDLVPQAIMEGAAAVFRQDE